MNEDIETVELKRTKGGVQYIEFIFVADELGQQAKVTVPKKFFMDYLMKVVKHEDEK